MRTVTYLTRRSALRRGALGAVGGLLLARSQWAGEVDLPLVRWVLLQHPDVPPSFDGLRIAQVSDVHAGAFMPPERLERVRALIEALEPDLIAFTGDQLDRREVDADLFVHGFAGLSAPLGTFGVLGNHDHLAGKDLAVAALEAVGATPLVNSGALIRRGDGSLLVAGVDDVDADAPGGPDFSAVTSRAADFRILLCHQPRGWRQGRAAGAEVTLAGHTHGGQITLPTRGVNLARLQTPYVAGPYRRSGHLLYVSRGVGVGAVPVRFGAPPEIDVVTLVRGPVGATAA